MAQKRSAQGALMSVRERILQVATAKDGFPESAFTSALAGAREALLIAKEQIGTHAVCVDEALSMCDDLVTELSDGTQGAENG